MEQRNIDGFNTEHPGVQFPECRSLTETETREIRRRLKSLTELPESAEDLALIRRIAAMSKRCAVDNADSKQFNLMSVLEQLKITPGNRVYLNFYRYDNVDEMAVNDVSRYFRFIWYPLSDDIDIFDDSLQWIISVDHDGIICALDLRASANHC